MIQSVLSQIATVSLAVASCLLWIQFWRAWLRSRLPVLFGLSWFFLFFAIYRSFWVWWHFAGRPPDYAFGWHVVVMLWAIAVSMALTIYVLARHDGRKRI